VCVKNVGLCFRSRFVGQQSFRWGGVGGEQIWFNGTYVSEGTTPAGSMWSKLPVPRCETGFEFSYVCPEPVLVKPSFIYKSADDVLILSLKCPWLGYANRIIICQDRLGANARRGNSKRERNIFFRRCRGPWEWDDCIGAENAFLEPFYTKTRSFYQDGLGTNIGKVEKVEAFLCRRHELRTELRRVAGVCGTTTIFFWSTFYAQIDQFTKTGSGQT
jgi:hypothetical protein